MKKDKIKIDITKLKLCWGMKAGLRRLFKSHIILFNLANLKRFGKWQAEKRFFHVFWHDMAKLSGQLRNEKAWEFAARHLSKCKRRNSNGSIPNDALLKSFIKIFTKYHKGEQNQ